MPPSNEPAPDRLALSARRDFYRNEVQRIVREGAEHPTCELVREMPLRTQEQKVDLVKLLQGMANAILAGERFLVVGADQGAKSFVPVANLDDFDPARLSQVLSRYLESIPIFESFVLEVEAGKPFVLIAIPPKQPKPFVIKSDLQLADGRFLLKKGDIWIKENTGLRRASKFDLDAMYEEESEHRARRWFDRLSNQLLSTQRLSSSTGVPIPGPDLIYGDVQTFRLYLQALIAGSHQRQFLMLIDLLRDLAIDGWNRIGGYSTATSDRTAEFGSKVLDHEKDYFIPATKAIVGTGILLVKHSADPAWLQHVVELLAEIFDSCGRLTTPVADQVINPEQPNSFGRYLPALEALIGIRTLVLYALRRQQWDALSFLMKKYVNSLARRGVRQPFVFWPFPGRIIMPDGLSQFCWRYRIGSSWEEYFGSSEEYEKLASQLEFLLEFSSWLGTSPEGTAWLAEYNSGANFAYWPDLVRLSLPDVTELAEKICDSLRRGPNDRLLVAISVEKSLIDVRLRLVPENAGFLLAAYLDYLMINRSAAAFRMGRFAGTVVWGDRVTRVLKDYRERKERGTLPKGLEFLPA